MQNTTEYSGKEVAQKRISRLTLVNRIRQSTSRQKQIILCRKAEDEKYLQKSGRLAQGIKLSSRSESGFSPNLGNLVSRCSKCPQTLRLFSFADSMIEYNIILASAPLFVSEKSQFFRPITNGFTARSARLLVSSSRPSSKTSNSAPEAF